MKNLFYTLSIIILCVAQCEFILYIGDYPAWWRKNALKYFHFATPDKYLGWRPIEGSNTFTDGTRVFTVTTWPGGRRATHYEQHKSGTRVVLLGDSFMQGYGLDDHDTIGWLLQQNFPLYNFENYACGGYGTQQVDMQVQLADKLIGGLPSGIIYLLIPAQLDRTIGHPETIRNYSPVPPGFFRLYAERELNGSVQIRKTTGIDIWPTSNYSRTSMLIEALWENLLYHKRIKERQLIPIQLLKEMNTLLKNKQVPFLLVLLDFEDKEGSYFFENLLKNGVDVINCSNTDFYRTEYRISDGHPNLKMNKELANCIGNKFKTMIKS